MADRSVIVRLRAEIGSYQASMAQAVASTKGLGTGIAAASRNSEEEFKKLGFVALGAGTAVGLGMGKAISASMSFEKQMSGVAAVSGASAGELDRLADAALAAGASTKLAGVSASEAAAAEAELVKAGVSVNDILGGALIGSLSLASAGQLEFADAATIAAQAMNIFELGGSDVEHVADVLAAAANKSATDVKGLGDALRQGGLVAAQTGLSLEETVGALAAFGDSALIGSDAGTSLKTMLQRLTPQSEAAAAKMEDLGFSAYDAQGNFIGLEGLAGELSTSFGGLDAESRNAALGIVFGSDAIRGANVLMKEGAEGIAGYVAAVDDQGAAARMAAAQMDNLAGDIETLGGAFETALIESGSKANGVMRGMVQNATDLVTGFTAMPDELQSAGMAIGGITAAGLGLMGAAGVLIPKIREVQTALQLMGTAGQFASRMMGPAALGGAGAVVGLTLLASAAGKAQRQAQELVDTITQDVDTQSLEGIQGGLAETRAEMARVREEWEGQGDFASDSFLGDVERRTHNVLELLTPLGNDVQRLKAEFAALAETEGDLYFAEQKFISNLRNMGGVLGLTEEEVFDLAQAAGVDLTGAFKDVRPALEAAYGEMTAGLPEIEKTTLSLEEQKEAAKALKERYEDLGAGFGGFTEGMSAYSTAYEAAEGRVRAAADEAAEAHNSGISERVEAVRTGAADTATALQQEAEDHIRAAGLEGQAAVDVRRAAEEKATAVRTAADDQAEALGGEMKTWEDYAGEVKVSIGEVIAQLEAQVAAQQEWKENLARIAAAGRADLVNELLKAGPEAADAAAAIAAGTTAEINTAADLWVQATRDGTEEMGAALEQEMAIVAALGAAGAKRTGESIAREFAVDLPVVQWIAAQYGFAMTTAISAAMAGSAEIRRTFEALPDFQNRTLIGGGREHGGPVSAGSIQPVNERGPELLTMGGQTMLMMGAQGGHVTPHSAPMTQAFGGGIDYDRLASTLASVAPNVSITVPGDASDGLVANAELASRFVGARLAGVGRG